jgi:DNA-nicking Smr family endonuclease
MRKPTDEDLDLWSSLTNTIKPLDHNVYQEPLIYKKERPKFNPDAFYPKPQHKLTYSVTEADYRDIKHQTIDVRIDLHGDTLDQACTRLSRFFTNAQRHGNKLALVITGKGRIIDGERVGVLRNEIPLWFKNNPQFVISFSTAQPHHGGDGAFYVRIRKLKGF